MMVITHCSKIRATNYINDGSEKNDIKKRNGLKINYISDTTSEKCERS